MKKKNNFRLILCVFFSLMVFFVLFVTMFLTGALIIFMVHKGIFIAEPEKFPGIQVITIVFAVSSTIIGTFVAVFVSNIPVKPINTLIDGMNRLAEGKYNTRISLGYKQLGQEMTRSFNTLAHELENTEMLRSDFINNFSHEFKTPIVSIRGFAKLLKKAELTEMQRMEYLDIIEEESERLAVMATNVLNLTKIENQNILTEQTSFNLSEQIRNSVLLLEKKWSKKNLGISLGFNEHMIVANEELLKEVWINLLDNAIKFSPEGEEISVQIQEKGEGYQISVANTGPVIVKEDRSRIMNKFYQADTSHASEGNGIGLAIVKKVVELHRGRITVESDERRTVFLVELPKE